MKHPFFKNYGPFKLSDILKNYKLNDFKNLDNPIINDVKDLSSANKDDITFLHSKKISFTIPKNKSIILYNAWELKKLFTKKLQTYLCR